MDIALKQANGPIQNSPLSETDCVNVMYSKRIEKSETLEKLRSAYAWCTNLATEKRNLTSCLG